VNSIILFDFNGFTFSFFDDILNDIRTNIRIVVISITYDLIVRDRLSRDQRIYFCFFDSLYSYCEKNHNF